MPRHSHQDALTEAEFEHLLEAAKDLKGPYDLECRLILFLGGRLGLRAGEITHLREDWIRWRDRFIEIPAFDACDLGQNDEPCGYCKKSARQAATKDDDVTYEEALAGRWTPKTQASIRTVPFGFDERVAETIEAFFFHHEHYPGSRCSVNRRVDRLAEAAGMATDRLYPHALRATAATHHAFQGVPIAALQALFGWSDLATPKKYIRLSGAAADKAMTDVYGEVE